ncbi:MAG: thiamine phosphate synthase [Prevotella sp.]|jgi:thiamine-phosphate pyrophosphorylase
MRIIVITRQDFFPDEAEAIKQLLQAGVYRVHLRKPESKEEDYAGLLRQLEPKYLSRIVLHDHFQLSEQFAVGGLHLNRRHPQPPISWRGSLSRSCHSLAELQTDAERFSYSFLSPIFDSISKQGYKSAFSSLDLKRASQQGIINERVGALGGVSVKNLPIVESYGFGYAALLGEVWSHWGKTDWQDYLKKLLSA